MWSTLRLRAVAFFFNRRTACAFCGQAGRTVEGRFCSQECADDAWTFANS